MLSFHNIFEHATYHTSYQKGFRSIYWTCHKVLVSGPLVTHWGPDKMAAIFQTTFWIFLLIKNARISIEMSVKFDPRGPINNIGSDDGLATTRWQAIINGG